MRQHLARRLADIRAELKAARSNFVFLAGNSHAEFVGNELVRLLPMVNGGLGGTTARVYATHLDRLVFAERAGVAVLFTGTNDILRRTAPLSRRRQARFVSATRRTLRKLRSEADTVLVAAVPPIGREAVDGRDPAAVAVYSALLRHLCDRHGCRWFDPFVDLRDDAAGLTTGAQPDGVHLLDYAGVATGLAALLGEIASEPVGADSAVAHCLP